MGFETLRLLATGLLTESNPLFSFWWFDFSVVPTTFTLLLTRSWQVGGPLAHTNKYLVKHPTDEKIAIGGIMNAKNLAPLRIDTTQHQMHAVMMALETLFSSEYQTK
jgi:hypothetical protein